MFLKSMSVSAVIAGFIILNTPLAFAELGASIPITVNIIQCGSRDNILKACEKEKKCCVFVEDNDEEDVQELAINFTTQ